MVLTNKFCREKSLNNTDSKKIELEKSLLDNYRIYWKLDNRKSTYSSFHKLKTSKSFPECFSKLRYLKNNIRQYYWGNAI